MATAVQTTGGGWRLRRAADAVEHWLDTERHQLALWLPVALGTGAAAYFSLPFAAEWRAVIALALALALAGLTIGRMAGRAMFWFGLFCALGLGLAWVRAQTAGTAPTSGDLFNKRFEAIVVESEVLVARDRFRLVLAPTTDGFPKLVRVTLRQAPGDGVKPGAKVAMRAALSRPEGPAVPGGYDFAFRAWFLGLGATGYSLGNVEVVAPPPPQSDFAARFNAFRDRLTRRIQTQVGGPEGAIDAAFVTGDRDAIPQDVNDQMRDAGLAHLLSISGLHIAVVIGGTMWVVRKLLCLSPWVALRWPVKAIAGFWAALAGIAYTILAGAEVPTVRSCLAAIAVLVGLIIGRQAISLRVVAAAAFLILAVRPEAVMNPSFQLSFGAIVSIVALYESDLGRRLLKRRPHWGRATRIGHGLFALLVTGVAAELALGPIALHHFGRNGVYGVIANLVAIPLSSFLLMPALIVALVLDIVGLAAPAWWATRLFTHWLLVVAAEVASWPGAVWRVPILPASTFALFIVGGLWLMLWRTRLRLLGFVPLIVAALLTITARPPDLLVSGDGKHAGVVTRWGRLALLRDRSGSFVQDMWTGATATTATVPMSSSIGTCDADSCVVRLNRGQIWTIAATRSKQLMSRDSFGQTCANADVMISERRLPNWCTPRWLKLDRAALHVTGAMAIWLDPLRIATAADSAGDHPWAAWARPSGAQWYRRSNPTRRPWTRTRDGR